MGRPLVPGAKVQDPISAYAQAQIINHHALTASQDFGHVDHIVTSVAEVRLVPADADTARLDLAVAVRTAP